MNQVSRIIMVEVYRAFRVLCLEFDDFFNLGPGLGLMLQGFWLTRLTPYIVVLMSHDYEKSCSCLAPVGGRGVASNLQVYAS